MLRSFDTCHICTRYVRRADFQLSFKEMYPSLHRPQPKSSPRETDQNSDVSHANAHLTKTIPEACCKRRVARDVLQQDP